MDTLGEIVQQRKAGDSFRVQPRYRLCDLWMSDRCCRNCVDPAPPSLPSVAKSFGDCDVAYATCNVARTPMASATARLSLGLELLIKGLAFLVQNKAQSQAHQIGLHPLPNQTPSA